MLLNLKHFFMRYGYREMGTNSNQIIVLFKENMDTVDVLVLNDLKSGLEITKEAYAHILGQVERSFYQKGYKRVTILSLLCTDRVEMVKPYCMNDQYTHWVIDMTTNHLLIYENQQCSYPQMSKKIEEFLSDYKEEARQADQRDWSGINISKESYVTQLKKFWTKYPVITISIVLANCIVFLLLELTGSSEDVVQLYNWGASAYYPVVEEHQYYRLFTSIFLHNGFDHLINNMFVLLVIGERLEKLLGKTRFTVIYFITGLCASVGSVLYYHWMGEVIISVGASGAIFGVVGGVFYLVLRYKGKVSGLSFNRMVLFVALSLFSGVSNSSRVDNVAHIVGFIVGIGVTCICDVLRKRKKVR